jgi:NitT/TauT family transport system substrate-binding protein
MDCCGGGKFNPLNPATAEPVALKRRDMLKFGGPALAAPFVIGSAQAAGKTIQIGFCSQFLCAPPYVVTYASDLFKSEGLDVRIVYFRGSPAVVQALAGGAIDYAASTFEDVLQAASHGVFLTRFLSTAKLPLFALAVAPGRVKEIATAKDLEGRTVGVAAVGAPSEVWTRSLMKQQGADGGKVRYVALGPNIFDALRLGQVDAAWVNEPSLTLLKRLGSTTLVNFMETDDATRVFGGRYEFMGLSTLRAQAAARRDEMVALGRAMNKGLAALQQVSPVDAIHTMPAPLLAGLDIPLLADVLERYRAALYPTTGAIDVAACERNVQVLRGLGLITPDIAAAPLLDLTIVPA